MGIKDAAFNHPILLLYQAQTILLVLQHAGQLLSLELKQRRKVIFDVLNLLIILKIAAKILVIFFYYIIHIEDIFPRATHATQH